MGRSQLFGFLLSFIASFVVFQHNEEQLRNDFVLSNRQFYYIEYFFCVVSLGCVGPITVSVYH